MGGRFFAFEHPFDEGYLEIQSGEKNAVVFAEDGGNADGPLLDGHERRQQDENNKRDNYIQKKRYP